MKVHLRALGCRLNQSEIDSMARQFASQGHHITENAEDADLFVINTCAVTQEATRSSRQLVYRLHRTNNAAEIAVTGCYAHIAPDEIREMNGVSSVIDNFDKASLVSIVSGEPIAAPELHDREPIQRQVLTGALGRTRAFIKVQDGCDRLCSFCVTRVARGKGRSRDLREIVAEVQEMSDLGYREAVLTGVHLGSYGHDLDQPDGLYWLVKALLDDTDIARIRVSSLEPWGIPENFFALWDDPRMGKHLHLPLQSGCDATLRRMIRRTSQREFRSVVEQARSHIPDLSITTDVIVGFPGETDAEFDISLCFIEEMQFAGMHIFRYSARPDTAAARLPNHVSEDIKKRRSDDLQAIHARDERRFVDQFVGSKRSVLWEAISGATDAGYINNGYTDNFIRVRAVAPQVLTDQITEARLVAWDQVSGVMLTG
ncbi:MAG: tRNA (N(6)-L-threonylcarbamoyladenosine(37)-C(2))-methylthiotransferase MtaB [Anaerolineae bacterium]|nr:tRNA (N(6)-L-threonylcarbamoyladenosine(37)-C(2))-methylthiotransferase MtaB [Anaerolineae bacterium]